MFRKRLCQDIKKYHRHVTNKVLNLESSVSVVIVRYCIKELSLCLASPAAGCSDHSAAVAWLSVSHLGYISWWSGP